MRCLPFDHALRNITRRPLRSALTVLASALVAGLLVTTSAFVRGLEQSHLATAPADTGLLLSTSALRDIVRSSISPAVAELVAADVPSVRRVNGVPAVSAEIHMGTDIDVGESRENAAMVRGVTDRAWLVHENVTLVEGDLPGPGEALVGRLAADKSGLDESALGIGRTVMIEGGPFRVSGVFAAPGTTIESEIWVSLTELQGLSQRDDCSAIFVRVEGSQGLAQLDLFSKRRLDLELEFIPADVYYAELAGYFGPILGLAWAMAILIGLAALTSGANTLVASVQDRVRELAALRAIGFSGPALAVTLLQEALILGSAGALVGLVAARFALARAAVSMAMTAFRFQVDAVTILTGLCGILVIVGVGTLPALARILRIPVARALKET